MRNVRKPGKITAMLLSLLIMQTMTFGDIAAVWADEADGTATVRTDQAAPEREEGDMSAADDGETADAAVDEATPEEIAYYEEAAGEALGAAEDFEDDDGDGEVPIVAKLVDAVSGRWVTGSSGYLNLRDKAKCTSAQYGIIQGCCSDGEKYVYFAFNRKSDDTVRVVKMQITENASNPALTGLKYVSRTAVLSGAAHGNDMAYVRNAGGSGKDKILIITSTSGGRSGTYIGMIDVATMKEQAGKSYNYWNDLSLCDDNCYPDDSTVPEANRRTLRQLVGDHHGYSTISYNQSKDLIVATVKTDRDLLILKPTWTSTGTLSKVRLLRYIRQNKNNATSQGIDSDDDFIYTSWSAMSGRLDRNIIQVYDWEGNHVGDRTISTNYEMEDLFHIGSGTEARFYATFYRSYTKPYKVRQKYKVKWKKVRRKVKGKWKKVWKYKTKYRYVTKYELIRDAHMMYLGHLTEDVEAYDLD